MAGEFDWTVRSFIGLGPLLFGMGPEQVARLLDAKYPVSASDPAYDGSVHEFRTMDCPVCSYMHGELHSIDTGAKVAGVSWNGMEVYATAPKQVLEALERANGGAKVGLGSVIFDNLGINTSGFFDPGEQRFTAPDEQSYRNRGLAVFRRGAFDSLLHEYAPVSFL